MVMDDRVLPDMAKVLGGTFLAWLLCLALSYGLTIREAKEPNPPVVPVTVQARVEAADKLLSTPFFMIVAALAISASLELRGDVHSRWHGITSTSRWAMMLYCSKMLIDIPIQQVSLSNDRAKLIQMTAHHVLSALAVGGGLAFGRLHYFAVLDICCEVTTIFLNTIFALKTLCAPNTVPGGIQGFLGLGLFVSFIVFRIMLFPYWGYQFATDVAQSPKDTWDAVHNFERYFYPTITAFLFVLSCMWMVPITKGLIKVLGLGGKKPRGEEAKKVS